MTSGGSRLWDVRTAVSACPIIPWTGDAWRCHGKRYKGDDPGGSLKVTGRFNRGGDQFPTTHIWPALYTGLRDIIALGESLRHTAALPHLANKRISHLSINLHAVLDGTSLISHESPNPTNAPNLDDLCHPTDYTLTHAIAEQTRLRGAKALLIPTCTRFAGNNLIIFADLVQPGSSVQVLDVEDPDLYIDWTSIA